MAKIVDPDDLSAPLVGSPGARTTEDVVIDVDTSLIHLYDDQAISGAAPSSTSGITIQALYSYLKEEWRTNATLIKYPFPMTAITEEKFDLINGWDFSSGSPATGSPTRSLLRTGGWSLRDASNVSQEEYFCAQSLGTFGSPTDLAYYAQGSPLSGNPSPVDFDFAGEIDQAVKVYGDATHGNFDYRDYFKAFLRIKDKLYDSYDLVSEQGLSTLDYKVYKFPLSNQNDVKSDASNASITGSPPWSGMSISYYSSGSPQTRNMDGTNYDFHVIVDGNNGDTTQIYEFLQYQLRQNSDIDATASSVIGKTEDDLALFTGDQFITQLVSAGGVYIDNYNANDVNNLTFTTSLGSPISFQFKAAGTLVFGTNAVADPYSIYRMFYDDFNGTPADGDEYGTSGAVIVNDDNGSPISGDVWVGSPNSEGITTGSWTTGTNTMTGGGGYTFGSPQDNGRAVLINTAGADSGKRFIVQSVSGGTATLDKNFETTVAGTGDFDVIEAQSSYAWTFNYDSNPQHSQGAVDIAVTVVSIGLDSSQYVTAAHTITRTTGQSIPLNPVLERNYANPI
jgi:hypothetical protein